MAEKMEILLNTERKPEVMKVLRLLDEMTPAEQKEMLVFMQGAKFAKVVSQQEIPKQRELEKVGG